MPNLKGLAIAGVFIFSDAEFPFATNNELLVSLPLVLKEKELPC
jgi:hypothetical protein